MRFFIALEITNESGAEIQAIQHQVSKILPHAKLNDYPGKNSNRSCIFTPAYRQPSLYPAYNYCKKTGSNY